ncbi:alpha/beta fold hydrolase, partial [Legionella sp. 29fVS95]
MDSIQTPDGRTLTYMSVGPVDGPLVLHQHGGPGSRYEALLLSDIAQSVGVRIVVVDRPGMGKSTLQRPRSFKGWADDLQSVATALQAEVFAVTGVSEGGPWALAAAYYISEMRLANVTCMAGACYGTFGTNWAARYLSKADAIGGRLAVHFRAGFSVMYAMLGLYVTRFPKQYAKTIMNAVCKSDQDVLKRPGAMDMFIQDGVECFRHGSSGLVLDAELLYK